MAGSKQRGAVTDVDKGWKAFKKTMDRLGREKPEVVIGLTGAAAEVTHRNSKRGENVATIAAKHEFGINVAERSFLRSTFDLNKDKYERYAYNGLRREVLQVAAHGKELGGDDLVTLKRIALKIEGDIKRRIGQRQIPPPNTSSTIRSKGSSTPLVDTGQMRAAITSAVRTGGKK